MKKKNIIIIAAITIGLFTACNQSGTKENDNTSNATAESSNTTSTAEQSNNTNDGRLSNAGKAKQPKGKMSFVVGGQLINIDENMVQCMYVGMNSTMAQSVISGGNQVTIVHMGIPKVGEVKIESIAGMPSVGVQVIIDGAQYNNKKATDAKLALTKVTQDGKNYYVAGTFGGTLVNSDGSKTITVTDGVFESAYQ
jgi:hypothetical protein